MTDFANDIPYSVALAAHQGTSMVPEKRAEQVRADYAAGLQQTYDNLKRGCAPEMIETLDAEFARFREGYRARYLTWLHRMSRCVSTMIAGPSNFPVRRAQKASNSADKACNDLVEFKARALAAIERTLHPELRPIMAGDDDAVERLRKEVEEAEKRQSLMINANKIIRSKPKYKPTDEKIAKLVALGLPESIAHELLKPDCMGWIGFADYQLRNNNANIRRMKERLAHLEKTKAIPNSTREGNGITAEDCPAENRIKLFFPGKPDQQTRSNLKAHGYRWAPSEGCWKAYRNNRAMEHAKSYVR